VKPASAAGLADLALRWSVPVGLILGWQALASAGWLSSRVLPAPWDVLRAACHLAATGELWRGIRISSQRAFTGFLIGGSIGLLLGYLSGMFRLWEKLFDSTIQMIRNIPHLAMIPLVILWFGIDEGAKLFLVVLGVFFPIYANTYHGVRSVDPKLREMARVYGLGHRESFLQVVLPGSLPSVLVGVRYSLGFMWLTLIVAETIAATSGIGYLTMNARDFMQTDVMVMGILTYALLGKLADSMAKGLEKGLLRWQIQK
jgi:sulfonate transport system permease protein